MQDIKDNLSEMTFAENPDDIVIEEVRKMGAEEFLRLASKEIVRVLKNLERAQPEMEPDERYTLAVNIVMFEGGYQ